MGTGARGGAESQDALGGRVDPAAATTQRGLVVAATQRTRGACGVDPVVLQAGECEYK
jgi:hypothetical protein